MPNQQYSLATNLYGQGGERAYLSHHVFGMEVHNMTTLHLLVPGDFL